MALLSGASLLPCLISEPLSQPEDMLDRLQLRQGSLQTASRTALKTGFCGARNAKKILTSLPTLRVFAEQPLVSLMPAYHVKCRKTQRFQSIRVYCFDKS